MLIKNNTVLNYHERYHNLPPVYFSLKELCHLCGVHAKVILEMVDEGLIEPVNRQFHWCFTPMDIQRVALHLRHLSS
jgi:hypothetical protein